MTKTFRPIRTALLIAMLGILALGCAHLPCGIAASSTPINGRQYTVMGRSISKDSRVLLLGFIPISGSNSIREAIEKAVRARGGDALINVTVEYYFSHWILFSKHVTQVDGDVIRFQE
jgi:hypothetical protein